MVGPPLHPATTFGRVVVSEPETGTDRGHAGLSSQPCTHEDQAEPGTGFIETPISAPWIWRSPLVGDRPPPQAESTRLPAKHRSVAARGAYTALMFADSFERRSSQDLFGEHELLRPARRPLVGRRSPRLTRCRIEPASRPQAASTTDWPGHRTAWGISVRVMPRTWAAAVHAVEWTRIAVRRLRVAATRGSCTSGEADDAPTGGRADLVLAASGGERPSESGMQHFQPPLVYGDDSLKPEM